MGATSLKLNGAGQKEKGGYQIWLTTSFFDSGKKTIWVCFISVEAI
jgi:hypothetical protein